MWVAKFKLKDEEDIYSPLCEKYSIDFYATPNTNFVKQNKINLLGEGIVSGSKENKKKFIKELKKDKRIKIIEQYKDFIFIHAQHPISREIKAEIEIFYNPQYIRIKPVKISKDGWEYWEVGCLNRNELNKIINVAIKHYNGKLFYIRQEKIKNISHLEFTLDLTNKQMQAIKIAFNKGYYNYPRKSTIPELAKSIKKSYSTFQENLRKAENKIISYLLKYR